MANPDVLGAITYEAETAGAYVPGSGTGWGEPTNTFTTHRAPIVAPVDCSGLTHAKAAAEFTEQYRGAGHRPYLGVMGGSFVMKLDLHGHGATTAGSPSIDAVETLLGIVFQNVTLSLTTSQTMTGGTASVPTTSGASGVSAGGVVRLGSLGDGNGDGQFYAVSTHGASSLNLINALRGAPTNGEVIYPTVQLYTSSAPTSVSVTGTRFFLQTANTQYRLHGCYPQSASFSGLSPGERPQLSITWGVSWWDDTSSATFPSVVTSNRYMPAPVAAGSLHVQDISTVTRNELTCRNFSIDYTLGVEPQMGPGGANAYQHIVGAVRTGNESCKVSFTVDSSAAGTVTLANWGRGIVDRTIVYTLSTTAASAVGFVFPKVCSTTVPVQIREGNINRVRFEGEAYTSDTLTSDLTRARMVLCYA